MNGIIQYFSYKSKLYI